MGQGLAVGITAQDRMDRGPAEDRGRVRQDEGSDAAAVASAEHRDDAAPSGLNEGGARPRATRVSLGSVATRWDLWPVHVVSGALTVRGWLGSFGPSKAMTTHGSVGVG
jgi:hypothetical protein